jgi:predicted outer membrane repeat protein
MKYALLFLVYICLAVPLAIAEEGQILTASSQNTAEEQDDSFLPLLIPALIAAHNQSSGPWADWPSAGNPSGNCQVPTEAQAEISSTPDHIIGDGTPQSCTSDAVVSTIAKGGIIGFNCGPKPIIIQLNETAKIVNTTGPKIVIDGGGKVALSGNNLHRILYMNTCDQNQIWTTPHCQNQDHPQLTVQNLVFLHGNSTSEEIYDGGGAIWARGGRLKIVNCRFFNNVCAATGPDVGGAAVRAFSQYQNLPLYVVNSTFGGAADFGNTCSNGGGLSSIGVSYSVINSLFSHNSAIGYGANPQRPGTPGGGSGGAIYNDGNTFDLKLCGTKIENNSAREGGGAIFFVSNDRSGHLIIQHSILQNNPSDNFENYPGIFYLGDGEPQITDSTLQ